MDPSGENIVPIFIDPTYSIRDNGLEAHWGQTFTPIQRELTSAQQFVLEAVGGLITGTEFLKAPSILAKVVKSATEILGLAKNEEKIVNKVERGAGKNNFSKGGPPRDQSSNYLPDPEATGAHSTFGVRKSKNGDYVQGATFDKNGQFIERVDNTTHSRGDHPNPHYHNATGSNSVKKGDFSKKSKFIRNNSRN